MEIMILMLIGFLFGIGFGFFVQRSGLCFAHGLGEIFMGRGKRILNMFLIIFIITSIGFFFVGLKTVGQIRGFGLYNILAGIIFGMGIFLSGGCILGTLRQLGEGNMMFLLTFLSFIPGMALVVYVLNPVLESTYNVTHKLLPEIVGLPASVTLGVLVALSAIGLFMLNKKKN